MHDAWSLDFKSFLGDVATWQLAKSGGLAARHRRLLPRGNIAAGE
jgi:hypothetical protein